MFAWIVYIWEKLRSLWKSWWLWSLPEVWIYFIDFISVTQYNKKSWRRIEAVITGRTRNALALRGTRVRIPPSPLRDCRRQIFANATIPLFLKQFYTFVICYPLLDTSQMMKKPPTLMLISGWVKRSFTHPWASSCGLRPFDPGIIIKML